MGSSHLCAPGDPVIIATFTQLSDADARAHRPRVVRVDEHNRMRAPDRCELAGPARRAPA
jgi:aspartate 1-decarboxylase